MAKIQCYGWHEYGKYRRYCTKLKKDDNKRNKDKEHITEEMEEPEMKKLKKEKVRYLYYDWDNLLL